MTVPGWRFHGNRLSKNTSVISRGISADYSVMIERESDNEYSDTATKKTPETRSEAL